MQDLGGSFRAMRGEGHGLWLCFRIRGLWLSGVTRTLIVCLIQDLHALRGGTTVRSTQIWFFLKLETVTVDSEMENKIGD